MPRKSELVKPNQTNLTWCNRQIYLLSLVTSIVSQLARHAQSIISLIKFPCLPSNLHIACEAINITYNYFKSHAIDNRPPIWIYNLTVSSLTADIVSQKSRTHLNELSKPSSYHRPNIILDLLEVSIGDINATHSELDHVNTNFKACTFTSN